MGHLDTLRDFKFKGDVDDIRGADLYGRGNEKLGKVDDIVFDHAGGTIQYLVVDTGGWLKSHKFLVPSDRVNARDERADFTCDLTRQQIERFPEYKDSIIRNRADWDAYEKRYRGSLEDAGGILHREGSDHLVTPEASELPAASIDTHGVDYTPTRLVDKFAPAEPLSGKTRLRPSGTAERAEDGKIMQEAAQWAEPSAESRNRRATDQVREADRSAFGDSRLHEVPPLDSNDPPSYRANTDLNSRIGQRYSSNRRLQDFEETLRKNRVDITSSCRACEMEKDEEEDAA